MSQAKRHHYVDTIEQVLDQAIRQQIIHLTCDDQPFHGAEISIDGRDLINFGSCSYLGLEQDPRLIEAVVTAVRRHGTQFSSSRAYLSNGLYQRLETLLQEIYAAPVIVTPTTSLGHQAALPVLVRDEDVVILDHQVHASVQNAVQLLKPRGIPVHLIRHNRLDQLEALIEQLRGQHRHIWYLADGVYSMYGDFAPLAGLQQLLDRHEQLHLYLDDAHGMSWCGAQGSGYVRSQMQPHPRVMLAVSLNKAFAASGGALVFPNQEWAHKVRTCGPTLIFSGPVQPPMLGAAVASAELHRSGAIEPLQRQLQDQLGYTRECLLENHLPLISQDLSPIFFIATGLPKVAYNLVSRLSQDGFYLNIGTFPATPMQRGGVRFTLTRHHQREHIARLAERMAFHYPKVLMEEGVAAADIEHAFDPPCDLGRLIRRRQSITAVPQQALRLSCEHSMANLDRTEWDHLFQGRGALTAEFLENLENVFGQASARENRWYFRYYLVRDSRGQVLLAAPVTQLLMKDDMFAPATVSAQLQQQRQSEPYLLTSSVLMTGTACAEGNPLYIDQQHPRWREALRLFTEALQHEAEQSAAGRILMRDFDQPDNVELTEELLSLGFIRLTMPDRYWIPQVTWKDTADYLAQMRSRYRYSLRKEALAYADQFIQQTAKDVDAGTKKRCYELYLQVQARGLEINSFSLPQAFTDSLFQLAESDVLRLYLREDPQTLVAVMFSHVHDGVYSANLVGLDYAFLESHKVYKQILYRSVERAHALGCQRVHLGFTAGLEKRKVGAVVRPTIGYALIRDHFNLDIVESMTVAATAAR